MNSKCVCPWWMCFTFDNPIRRFVQNPEPLLSPFVKPGDHVLDVGAGMGYFSIPLAKLVGQNGRITAIDIQPQMLSRLERRAERHGLSKQIRTYLSSPNSIGSHDPADFILTFWMVHEVNDQPLFFKEILTNLKPDGHLLFVEPKIHVSKSEFNASTEIAHDVGLAIEEFPKIPLSRSALLIPREKGL